MKKDEQAESIKPYRETDAQMLRQKYLDVIELHTGDDGKPEGDHHQIKNYLKALSDLAKLQHLHKETKEDGGKDKKEKSPFSKAEESKLDERLKETLGDMWTGSKENT